VGAEVWAATVDVPSKNKMATEGAKAPFDFCRLSMVRKNLPRLSAWERESLWNLNDAQESKTAPFENHEDAAPPSMSFLSKT
jgi:hypothetical protein